MTLRVSKKPKTDKTVTLATLNEIAARASERFNAARARKLAKSKDSGLFSQTLVTSVWKEAFSRAHKGHPCVFTQKDILILKKHLGVVQTAGTDAVAYLTWVVESWAKVVSARFAWMTNARPQFPSVRFMVKFSEEFQAAYAKRDEIERMANMTASEKLIARRVDRGMTEEAAVREITGEQKPVLKQLHKFDETKERVERMRRPLRSSRLGHHEPPTKPTFEEWKE